MRLKAVNLLVSDALPEDIRGELSGLDANGMGAVLAAVAKKYPDQYEDIADKLSRIGRNASYWQGETLTLKDVRPVLDRAGILAEMDTEVGALRTATTDDKEFQKEREKIWERYSERFQGDTMSEALRQGNNIGFSVASGARGKPAQLKAMLSTPALYAGPDGKTIPVFIRNGFNNGLRPHEYLAGTYGARSTVISTKVATAKGGYLGKLMAQAAAPVVVSEKDCGVDNGLDFDLDDPSLRGRLLARKIGEHPAGSIIDRAMLADLRRKKVGGLIARSPLTCGSEAGVCARCTGADARGELPAVGDAVGITAVQALSEPIAQGALSSKHTAGQAEGKKEYSGFDVINRFVQTPEQFEDRAVVAENDGRITKVEPAPQGGTYVYVNDARHYILPGYPVTVGVGDAIEAGEQLAEGLGDPGDVVRLRGLGEGRRYYSNRLADILKDSGMPASKRNTEMLARAALDHMLVDDADGLDGLLPDDVVSYSRVRRLYEPPEDTQDYEPPKALGKFLQRDALHYTIGTRITPKVADHLQRVGWGNVSASAEAPSFRPQMVRLQSSTHNNPDWLASQHTSYLKKQLTEDASRGRTTNIDSNIHFAPRLAKGEDFGKNVRDTGKF
jgi:DNA-directed RNA polymerase subunit beta'